MTKDIILSKFLKNNLTVCPVCKVKQFKIDRRGALICKHGHESKNFRIELSEFDDITISYRTIKPSKLKNIDNTDDEIHNEKINYKYEAFQFILKTQVKALIVEKHFPKEYANIVKSLWILFINSFGNNDELLSDINKRKNEEWLKLKNKPFYQKYENVFLNELIKNLMATSSVNDSSIIRYLIVILFLGCIWLRMPVFITDFNYWICHEEIPYNTAIYCIPENILKKISKNDHFIFKPKYLPTCEWLEKKTFDVISFYKRQYNVIFPEINVPLVLFRYTSCLALPPELFLMILRYIKLAKFEFSFRKDRNPYVLLLATMIFCVKLVYGLDDVQRKNDSFRSNFFDFREWLTCIEKRRIFFTDHDLYAFDRNIYSDMKVENYIKYCEKLYYSNSSVNNNKAYNIFSRELQNYHKSLKDEKNIMDKKLNSFKRKEKSNTDYLVNKKLDSITNNAMNHQNSIKLPKFEKLDFDFAKKSTLVRQDNDSESESDTSNNVQNLSDDVTTIPLSYGCFENIPKSNIRNNTDNNNISNHNRNNKLKGKNDNNYSNSDRQDVWTSCVNNKDQVIKNKNNDINPGEKYISYAINPKIINERELDIKFHTPFSVVIQFCQDVFLKNNINDLVVQVKDVEEFSQNLNTFVDDYYRRNLYEAIRDEIAVEGDIGEMSDEQSEDDKPYHGIIEQLENTLMNENLNPNIENNNDSDADDSSTNDSEEYYSVSEKEFLESNLFNIYLSDDDLLNDSSEDEGDESYIRMMKRRDIRRKNDHYRHNGNGISIDEGLTAPVYNLRKNRKRTNTYDDSFENELNDSVNVDDDVSDDGNQSSKILDTIRNLSEEKKDEQISQIIHSKSYIDDNNKKENIMHYKSSNKNDNINLFIKEEADGDNNNRDVSLNNFHIDLMLNRSTVDSSNNNNDNSSSADTSSTDSSSSSSVVIVRKRIGRRSRNNLKILNHIMDNDNDEEEVEILSSSKPKQGIKRKLFINSDDEDLDDVNDDDNDTNSPKKTNGRKRRILNSNSSHSSPKTEESIQSNDKIQNDGNQKYDDDNLDQSNLSLDMNLKNPLLPSNPSNFNFIDTRTNVNNNNIVSTKSNTSINIANNKSNTNINVANTNSNTDFDVVNTNSNVSSDVANINTNTSFNGVNTKSNTSTNIVTNILPNTNSNSNNNNGVNLSNLENITNTTIINSYNNESNSNDIIQTNIEFNVSSDKPVDIPKNSDTMINEKDTNGAPVGIVPSNTSFEIAIPSSSFYRIQSDNNMNKNRALINLLEMKLKVLDNSFDGKNIKSSTTPFSETKQSFIDGLKPLSMTNTNHNSLFSGIPKIPVDNFVLLDEKIRALDKLSKTNVKSHSSVKPMDNYFNSIPKNVIFNSKNRPFKFLTSHSKNSSIIKNSSKSARRVNRKREKKKSYKKKSSLKDSLNNDNKNTTNVDKKTSTSKSSTSISVSSVSSVSTTPKKDELGFFIDGKFINENDIEFDDGDEEYEDIDEKSHKRKFFSTRKRF